MKLTQLVTIFLEIFFPAHCHHCRSPLRHGSVPFFCDACWSTIRPLGGPFCPQCGKSFVSASALSFSPTHRCGDCRKTRPQYDSLITPYSFEGVLSEAISLLKYQKKTALIPPLSRLAFPFLTDLSRIDFILPVPLHSTRLKAREFNQSLLLAETAGRLLRKPLEIHLLKKNTPTDPQMKLSQADRKGNLKNSFTLANPGHVKGKTILVVDDVFTTGATLNECAKVLKKGGCRKVVGFALARTLLRSRDPLF
ncbi:MAG: ComF family protein [Nitrospirae bacterium]|nr:ComF family protein [Nitrospirota bacterium]